MRQVSIVGIGQLPVQRAYQDGLRQLGAKATHIAMENACVSEVDALFAGNMLADELQNQKHLAALIADEAGLRGVEAIQVRAATASGAAALRMAYLAVASGEADLAVAVGVEKMSEGNATAALSKALDSRIEVMFGASLISKNAELMRRYLEQYALPANAFANFGVNAHKNGVGNPNARFQKAVTAEEVMTSRMVYDPLRLMDCSPVCDGAAAVVLAPRDQARAFCHLPVHILASSVATDRFRVADRDEPLHLKAAQWSAQRAFRRANVNRQDIDFVEVHDAFSIMACLLLESAGFAEAGEGWRLAAEMEIGLDGQLPICTMGGLKARGHPIGATALYQTCEIVQQLTGMAGANQLTSPRLAMMQSIGGAGTTILCHIFGI